MSYDNVICSGCSKPMHDDDDIVVCPVCGTPQHRDCYNKNGCCVNENLHSQGFVWQAPEKPKEEIVEKPVNAPEENQNTSPVHISPIDGNQLEAFFLNNVNIEPEEEFDGITVGEAAIYIQNGSKRYIKKFMKNSGKKRMISWNWAAFFFNPHWFFYRKLYKLGFIFLGVVVALNVAFVSQADKIETYYEYLSSANEQARSLASEYQSNPTDDTEAKIMELYGELSQKTKEIMPTFLLYFAVVILLPNIIAALIANGQYKKKMLMDIDMARKSSDDPKLVKLSLIRSGGVSFFAAMGSIIVVMYLPSLLLNIATKINL
jgi:uncharacterized Zn finger protein (UPF0148 family)